MNKHIKRYVLVLAICSLLLSACSFSDTIASGLGYVPKSQLEKANDNLTQATKDLEESQKSLSKIKKEDIEVNAKIIALARELADSKDSLAKWQNMQCIGPDHKPVKWNDLINKYAVYTPFKGYHAEALMADYHFSVGQTQWLTLNEFDPYKGKMDTILFDDEFPESLAIDITKDCLILGPKFAP